MRSTISGMLGTLPPQFFDVEVRASGESLAQLMFSVLMTGYLLRNAECVPLPACRRCGSRLFYVGRALRLCLPYTLQDLHTALPAKRFRGPEMKSWLAIVR